MTGPATPGNALPLRDPAPAGSRPALGAFLGAFHRYLVILGAEPLLDPLPAAGRRYPPHASVIWVDELQWALRFVDRRAPSEQVRLQARLILLLGFLVPLRPAEYWSIRIVDVKPDERLTLHIYSRIEDGGPKAAFTRRTVDIESREVAAAVLELYELRLKSRPGDEARLLGDERVPGGRHHQRATERLVKEALVWASGEPRASEYDLRHTAISALEQAAFRQMPDDWTGSDRVPNLVLQARSGQRSRRSVECYVHCYEEDIAATCRSMRPQAWENSPSFEEALAALPRVSDGLVRERAPIPEGSVPTPVARSHELSLSQRQTLLSGVAQRRTFEALCGFLYLERAAILSAVRESLDAGQRARLLPFKRLDHDAALARELGRLRTWAKAANAPKWNGVIAALNTMADSGQWSRLSDLWLDWCACVRVRYFSVESDRPAARLVRFLVDECKVRPQQLALFVSRGSPEVLSEMASLGLEMRPCDGRKGRPKHRLVVSPPGARAKRASPRVLSMMGLHWLFLVVGSAIEARRGRDE